MPCRKIVKETVDKFGQLDVLVNNASFQGKDVEKFEDITRERLEFTFHSNILAYFTVAQAAVPHMPKGSAIININSIQGYQPSFGVLDYACTKVLHHCVLHAHTPGQPLATLCDDAAVIGYCFWELIRICQHCHMQAVEDEQHFSLDCPLYTQLGNIMISFLVWTMVAFASCWSAMQPK